MSPAEVDESQQPGLIALCVVMLTLSVVSVCLRCYSIRVSGTHMFGYDDAFAILTLVCAIPIPPWKQECFSLDLNREDCALNIFP